MSSHSENLNREEKAALGKACPPRTSVRRVKRSSVSILFSRPFSRAFISLELTHTETSSFHLLKAIKWPTQAHLLRVIHPPWWRPGSDVSWMMSVSSPPFNSIELIYIYLTCSSCKASWGSVCDPPRIMGSAWLDLDLNVGSLRFPVDAPVSTPVRP